MKTAQQLILEKDQELATYNGLSMQDIVDLFGPDSIVFDNGYEDVREEDQL